MKIFVIPYPVSSTGQALIRDLLNRFPPCATVPPSPEWLRRPSKAMAARGRGNDREGLWLKK